MSSKERHKRPKLARHEPLRRWSTLFDGSTSGGEQSDAPRLDAAAPLATGDAISRSVELGYRVVDEYVRQGQRAARLLSQPPATPQAMATDVQRIYFDHLAQLTRFWTEAMQVAAPVAGRVEQRPASISPAAEPIGEPARVRIEIASARPTTVSLDLRPEAGRERVVVHALRAADADKPRLTDVTFEPAAKDEPARLRINVPPEQPPGTYSGLLVDEATNRPIGTLSVDIA